MTEYPYASGNLIDSPNSYFYSAFGGAAFLRDWQHQRDDALRFLGEPGSPPPGRLMDGGPSGWPLDTALLLDHVFAALSATGNSPESVLWLERLIKKFEVTKRIHESYAEGFLAADKTRRHNLDLYVRLAEVFDLAYRRTDSLPALNALLKIIDTLCSQRDALAENLKPRLARLIENERGYILALADAREVAW